MKIFNKNQFYFFIILIVEFTKQEPIPQTFSDQLIDHFNLRNQDTFQQRFWVIDEYFDHDKGPALLFICGEQKAPGMFNNRQFVVEIAKNMSGIIFILEHRFQGASQPFLYGENAYTLESLQYLTVEQALADISYFIQQMKLNKTANITEKTPWITIGAAYAGGLSAWFRFKYPHLTIGAQASSALINPSLNLYEADKMTNQTTAKSGSECTESVKNIITFAQELIENEAIKEAFKSQFNDGKKLTDIEILNYFADLFLVYFIEFNNRTGLCEMLRGKNLQDQLFSCISQANIGQLFFDIKDYSAKILQDTKQGIDKLARQWAYQVCTELGWFVTGDYEGSMRSKNISLGFYKNWCKEIFGADLWPDIEKTNLRFAGKNISISNLIITNGDEDPFKVASLLPNPKLKNVQEIKCTNCGHCVDLKTPTESDPPEVKDVRRKIIEEFNNWAKEYWENY